MSIRTYFENIADAIRQKTGTQDTYAPDEMPDAIINLPSGGSIIADITIGNVFSVSGTSFTAVIGNYYLVATIYDGGTFSGADVIYSNKIFTSGNYGRYYALVRATSTTVSYSRTGSIENYFVLPFAVDESTNNFVVSVTLSTLNTNSFSANENNLYLFITYPNYKTGTFTGAEVLAQIDIGANDSNRAYLLLANSDIVTFSNSATTYYLLHISFSTDVGVNVL